MSPSSDLVTQSNRVARPPLDGTWRMREYVMDGTASRPVAEVTWTVREAELVIRHDGVVQRPPGATGYALTALDGRGAGAVDYVVRYASGRTHTLPGVFAVDGDTLSLCVPVLEERPTDCTPGPDRIVYTFERVAAPGW